MSAEFYAILAVGVSLAGLALTLHRSLRADVAAVRADVASLRADLHALAERVARLEGAFSYFAAPRPERRERTA